MRALTYRDFWKRPLDLAAIAITTPLWAPLLLFALAIASLSGRPLFFRQTRMGYRCASFSILKIRTMRPGVRPPASLLFPGWTSADDPRVTGVGRFLRRYRLDELPQLWNVVKGDMSLVGPRPEPLEIANALGEALPRFYKRYDVRPGITGLCQISNDYYDFGTIEKSAKKLEHDLAYVDGCTLIMDLTILLRTVRAIVVHRGMA